MRVVCLGCGKTKNASPSDIKNPDEYYCRKCRPKYVKTKKEWDWSTLKYLNKVAISNGHESIWKQNQRDTTDL